MATSWTSYLPEVEAECRGVPRPMAVNAVREAAREFARRSKLFRETLSAINVVAEQEDYTLTPATANSRIIAPSYVEYDGTPVLPYSEDLGDFTSPTWRNTGIRRYHMADRSTLRLMWEPDTAITDGLIVRVILEPTINSTSWVDRLHDDWRTYVAAGARARLKGIPGEKWTSSPTRDEAMFRQGINDAFAEALRGATRDTLKVKARPFA